MNADTLLSRIAGHHEGLAWIPTARPMDNSRLNAVMVALHRAPESGLPWSCANTAERNALKDLAGRGLIEICGRTRSQAARLLPAGIFAGWQDACGMGPEAILATMERIRRAPRVKTPRGTSIVMGFELVESAGDWWQKANRTDAAWETYRSDLEGLKLSMLPLVLLGWLRLYVAVGQVVWGVAPTNATAIMPDNIPEVNSDPDAWEDAFDKAADQFTNRPPNPGPYLWTRLPASCWC